MICPEVGTSSRLSDLKNVDLPQPEGPIMAITSPLVIVVLMSLSTTWSPNVFLRFFTSRITLVRKNIARIQTVLTQKEKAL